MKKYVLVLLLIIFLTPTVYAQNVIDFTKKGSLSITLIESQNSERVENAEIEIIKIADADLDVNNNLAYKKINEIDKCDIILTNLESDGLKVNIESCINDLNITGIKATTDANGNVIFNNLDLGLYLVRQTNEVKGYSTINSYLVTIPTIIDNSWEYDLESEPKTEIIKLMDLKVNKIWKTDRKISDYVMVQLVLNDKVIDTVKLSKDNNWEYTWRRIPLSDEYEINEINIPKGYTAIYEKNNNNYTVINADNLPHTGQNTYIAYIIGVSGIILFVLGFGLYKKQDK